LVGSIFHMTRKIVSEMTYNVSMGTLNPTIPYRSRLIGQQLSDASGDLATLTFEDTALVADVSLRAPSMYQV